jgi:hypothetical protein
MRTIETAIDIEAPTDAVWAVVTEFAAYPSWNPFMVHIEGDLEPGARLAVTMQNPGGRPTKFRPVVLASERLALRWVGHVLVNGIFDGTHELRVEATATGSRFVQREEFSGVLVPLFWRTLTTKTRSGFEAMNEALNDRVMSAKGVAAPERAW